MRKYSSRNAGALFVCAAAIAALGCSGTIDDPISTKDSAIGGGNGSGVNGSGSTKGGTNGGGSGSGGSDDPSTCSVDNLGTLNVRRLSHVEYNRTVTDMFPGITLPEQEFAADLKVHGFENNAKQLNPSSILIEQYSNAADRIAELVAADSSKVLPCSPAGATDMDCAKQAIAALGKKAFRRPLTAEEAGRYEAFFQARMTDISWNAALELTLSALLQSPQFLYRLEFGGDADNDSVVLTDYEMASRLSYFFWQSLPDDELFDAAESGSLHDKDAIEAQARRMLNDPRSATALADFHRQWLDFDRLLNQNKDPVLFPDWNDSVRSAMYQESEKFVGQVFGEGSGTISELLTSTTTFVNSDLAKIYGVKTSADATTFEKVELPATERSGVLTLGTFLASRAHSTNGSPPLRGVAVLDALLCDRPPPPPPTANTSAPMQDPAAPKTNRDLFEQRTSPSLCQTCHKQINGIGYGFEQFDSTGGFRTTDNGEPVNAKGELIGTDVDGKYDGAVELAQKLSQSKQVEYCVVRNVYRYAHGRDEDKNEGCKLDALDEALAKSGGDLRELMVQIAISNEFTHRPTPTTK